jgi:DNA-binding GntR family transcriptional regulator
VNALNVSIRLKEPIAPQLVAALRQGIAELRLRPGEALSEKDIAARFGVSRQPVREAFIKLSEAGLVEIRPSRGTYVLKISVREIANARFVREAIECDITRNAARLATPAAVVALRTLLAAQREAAAKNEYWRFNDHDEAFHRAIADMVQCEYAWRVVEGARIQTDRVRYLSLPDASPMPLLISQHETIVDSLEAGDADGAEAAMRRHLREILVALPQIAKANPDLFADIDLPDHTAGLVPVE